MVSFVYRPDHPEADEFGMVDKRLVGPRFGSDDAPNIISDTMDALVNHADGKKYESKSEFRKATKAAGYVEYGNEVDTLLKPRKRIPLSREKRRDDIRRTIYELRNGIRRD